MAFIRTKCRFCHLPTETHFAHCIPSGIRGLMPEAALRPGAVMTWPGEERLPILSPAQRLKMKHDDVKDRLRDVGGSYKGKRI
jgi:hypothetical protein